MPVPIVREGASEQRWSEPSAVTPFVWSVCGVGIVLVAVVLRLFALDLKPLHHDEGVNGLFMIRLALPPHTYRYDPADFHGPTLYFLTTPVALGIGLTTFTLRLVPAVCGIGVVLLAFGLRRPLGALGALTAAALLAVSPGAVYFSRYFIHETPLVFFTFAAVVAAWQYTVRQRGIYLMLASAFAALMFATKETAIIAAVVLLIAAGMAGRFPTRWHRRRGGGGPETLQPSALVGLPRRHDAPSVGAAAGYGDKRRMMRRVGLFIACTSIFVGLNVLFYSSFFTHWDGIGDAFRSFAIWTRTGNRSHLQPWHTYLRWLARQEAPLLVFGTIGIVLSLWQGKQRFVIFAALWALGMLAAYSLIPYKTPWLTLNTVVPLALVSGWTAEAIFVRVMAPWRRRAVVVGLLVLSASTYQSVMLNFARYDDDRQPYVYAHTRRAVLDLVAQIDRIMARRGPALTIAVTAPEHFPLPWYLKAYSAGYYGRVPNTRDAIFIGSTKQDDALKKQLGAGFVRSGPYSLRPGVDLVLYVRRDVMAP
jgi:uncharacterized protein (TIGR03663 family)